MVTTINRNTDKTITLKGRQQIVHNTDESDLVRSGLKDTVSTAYQPFRKVLDEVNGITHLCTAAFYTAIEKIGVSY